MKHSSIQDWLMNWFWEINISDSVKLADFPSLLGEFGAYSETGLVDSKSVHAQGQVALKKKFNPCEL